MKNQFLLFRFLFLPAMTLLLVACSKPTGISPVTPQPPPASGTPTTPTQPVNNKDSIFNGVNLQPSYYNGGNVTFGWDLMKQQPKIKTVRIEIEPDKAQQAKSWIKAAKDNGFTVIATYHKYTVLGSDNESELIAAANWWKANYQALGGNFIINLMNEWGSHNITASAYATAYNNALSIVRSVYSGPVVIDIPGWGQETYTAAQACKTSTPAIADTNIILSAHVYPNGWNQGRNQGIRASHLDDITAVGRRGMIGEFGNGTTGNADWAGIVDYAKQKGWPVLGWAWNGDGGSMNMVTPTWGSNATSASYAKSTYFNTIYDRL